MVLVVVICTDFYKAIAVVWYGVNTSTTTTISIAVCNNVSFVAVGLVPSIYCYACFHVPTSRKKVNLVKELYRALIGFRCFC